MPTALLAAALLAGDPTSLPDGPLARVDEPLRVARYARVIGEGPAWPRWRKRSGPIEAWSFPDWQIAQYRTWSYRRLVSEHRFDAHGALTSVTTFGDGAIPQRLELHRPDDSPQTLEVASWPLLDAYPLTSRTETTPVQEGPHWRWQTSDHTLTLTILPAEEDPLTDAFRSRLARECGCLLIDRASVWVDGHPGVHYRVELPHLTSPVRGDIWAFARHDRLIVLTAVEPDGVEARRAAYALLALLRWQEPREPE